MDAGRDHAEQRAHTQGSFRSPTPRTHPLQGLGASPFCHRRVRQGSFRNRPAACSAPLSRAASPSSLAGSWFLGSFRSVLSASLSDIDLSSSTRCAASLRSSRSSLRQWRISRPIWACWPRIALKRRRSKVVSGSASSHGSHARWPDLGGSVEQRHLDPLGPLALPERDRQPPGQPRLDLGRRAYLVGDADDQRIEVVWHLVLEHQMLHGAQAMLERVARGAGLTIGGDGALGVGAVASGSLDLGGGACGGHGGSPVLMQVEAQVSTDQHIILYLRRVGAGALGRRSANDGADTSIERGSNIAKRCVRSRSCHGHGKGQVSGGRADHRAGRVPPRTGETLASDQLIEDRRRDAGNAKRRLPDKPHRASARRSPRRQRSRWRRTKVRPSPRQNRTISV